MTDANSIEVMAQIKPSPQAWLLLDEHCGACNGTCDPPSRTEHALLIEIALLRRRFREIVRHTEAAEGNIHPDVTAAHDLIDDILNGWYS